MQGQHKPLESPTLKDENFSLKQKHIDEMIMSGWLIMEVVI